MSGIAGIVNLDGRPVDRRVLAQMTKSLTFRGPDLQRMWIDGPAGFGHTLLKTIDESGPEQQPFTLNGRVHVVADARIDSRRDLVAELRAHKHEVTCDASDVELIAHAYCIWQEDCVDHLLGDFAFGVWDAPRKQLFCARDHMGIKPVYYACIGSCVVFSNTLDCIRLHPLVSDRLNDLAVADFLLFNVNWDKAKTTFADIEQLPPANTLICSERALQLRRYWTIPIDEPVFYPSEDDYIDRFQNLLQTAVDDRLRTSRISLFMSGGLDSTTLASAVRHSIGDQSANSQIRAFTMGNQSDDKEFYYAALVAKSLGLSIEFRKWDPKRVDPEWYTTPFHTPEPIRYPTDLPSDWTHFQAIASHSRVIFYGEGPDNALRCEWQPYFSYLVREKRFGQLIYDLYFQTVLHRRIPFPTMPWLPKCKHRNKEKGSWFPNWFNPAFEKRLDLRSRWEHLKIQPLTTHPIRPKGYDSLSSPAWQALFREFDAAYTRSPLEVRHPFLDVRLLRFMLAVPALPWCRSKYLIRRSMRDRLPEPVLARPKSPLVNDPWAKHVMELGLPPINLTPVLEQYLDGNQLVRNTVSCPEQFWVDFRVRSLGYWLKNMNFVEKSVSHPVA